MIKQLDPKRSSVFLPILQELNETNFIRTATCEGRGPAAIDELLCHQVQDVELQDPKFQVLTREHLRYHGG